MTSQKPNQVKGKLGENLAAKLLSSKGYHFVAANYRASFGEIDLIFTDQETLVFVEVKTRQYLDQGLPEEAVTRRKLSTIRRLAELYMLEHNLTHKLARIDVVAIELTGKKPVVRHLIDVAY